MEKTLCNNLLGLEPKQSQKGCEREGIVGGDEAPVGGVAQVVSHGVKVVGVEEGQEKDEKVPVEVKGEVEQLREKRSSWMVWIWNDGLKDDLSQCGCDK